MLRVLAKLGRPFGGQREQPLLLLQASHEIANALGQHGDPFGLLDEGVPQAAKRRDQTRSEPGDHS